MRHKRKNAKSPRSSKSPDILGFSFQEDLWFGDFDDDAARETAASSMAAMAGRVMGARPFPAAAQRLVQLTRREDTKIQKVVRVLESDPGLSQRVLRLVNSAGYGLRVRCTSLNHATALLGQQRLQQIATSAVLLDHFGKTSDVTRRKQEHGSLVASLCRYLAIHLGLPQEDLFTCGLLHDLGQLMMLDEGEDEYKDLVAEHEEHWDSLHISEREILGFDHAVLAAHVLASWSIPAPIPEVIALHHQPALAHQRGPKISAMVQTLRFADHMSHLLDTRSPEEGAKELADSEAASYLSFSEMQIAAMWADLRQLSDANRNRRMDIADIAPRSIAVPDSLSPRAIPLSGPPEGFSLQPGTTTLRPALGEKEPPIPSEAAEAVQVAPLEEELSGQAPEPPFSGQGADLNVLRLSNATPNVKTLLQPTPLDVQTEEDDDDFEEDRASEFEAQPEVFPCAICYGPTFGARCPVCLANVCSSHQTTTTEWCMACEDEYREFVLKNTINSTVKIAVGSFFVVTCGSTFLLSGAESGFATIGICLTAILASYTAHLVYLKVKFKRSRQLERVSSLPDGVDFSQEAPTPTRSTSQDTALPRPVKSTASSPTNDSSPPVEEKPSYAEGVPSSASLALQQSLQAIEGDREPLGQLTQPPVSNSPINPENFTLPVPKIIETPETRIMAEPTQEHDLGLISLPPPPAAEELREVDEHEASQISERVNPSSYLNQETVPAPQATQAPLAVHLSEPPPPASQFSWPPSQDTPGSIERPSLHAPASQGESPRLRFSSPPSPIIAPPDSESESPPPKQYEDETSTQDEESRSAPPDSAPRASNEPSSNFSDPEVEPTESSQLQTIGTLPPITQGEATSPTTAQSAPPSHETSPAVPAAVASISEPPSAVASISEPPSAVASISEPPPSAASISEPPPAVASISEASNTQSHPLSAPEKESREEHHAIAPPPDPDEAPPPSSAAQPRGMPEHEISQNMMQAAPTCEPAQATAQITPPPPVTPREFCTSPGQAAVRILPLQLQRKEKTVTASNDQNQPKSREA